MENTAAKTMVAEPQGHQRQHHDHRHRVEAVHVMPQQAVDGDAAPYGKPDHGAEHQRDGEPLRHRQQCRAGRREKRRAGDHSGKCRDDAARLGDIGGRGNPHHALPEQQDDGSRQNPLHRRAGYGKSDARCRRRGEACWRHG
jgi:hypothetical protein